MVRISTVTRLEVGHSARSGTDLRTGLRTPPAGLVVLHCDGDFDLIAELTGQPLDRIDANNAGV